MKTIEQIAEKIAIDADCYSEQFGWQRIDLELACYEMAKHIQRWIPVEEESPSEYEYVLAKSSVGDVYVACFSDYTFHTGMPHKVNITHWRPIEYK